MAILNIFRIIISLFFPWDNIELPPSTRSPSERSHKYRLRGLHCPPNKSIIVIIKDASEVRRHTCKCRHAGFGLALRNTTICLLLHLLSDPAFARLDGRCRLAYAGFALSLPGNPSVHCTRMRRQRMRRDRCSTPTEAPPPPLVSSPSNTMHKYDVLSQWPDALQGRSCGFPLEDSSACPPDREE
jgi:hypothetical protein